MGLLLLLLRPVVGLLDIAPGITVFSVGILHTDQRSVD